MSDDSFREIQLNGKQLVFLFMAATVVFVVIFLCGVLVGRGVRPEGLSASNEPAASAAQPAESAVEMPPAVPADTPPTPADGDLTYDQRLLASDDEPKDTLKPESAKAAPAAVEAKSAPVPAPAPTPTPTRADTSKPAAAERAAMGEPAGTGFAVQIAAMSERAEAEGIVKRLSGKGYSAYVLPPQSGGAGVYRVRVGKFKTRREAEGAATRLEKEEQFKPWIIR